MLIMKNGDTELGRSDLDGSNQFTVTGATIKGQTLDIIQIKGGDSLARVTFDVGEQAQPPAEQEARQDALHEDSPDKQDNEPEAMEQSPDKNSSVNNNEYVDN